jgi:hypothetical protein
MSLLPFPSGGSHLVVPGCDLESPTRGTNMNILESRKSHGGWGARQTMPAARRPKATADHIFQPSCGGFCRAVSAVARPETRKLLLRCNDSQSIPCSWHQTNHVAACARAPHPLTSRVVLTMAGTVPPQPFTRTSLPKQQSRRAVLEQRGTQNGIDGGSTTAVRG